MEKTQLSIDTCITGIVNSKGILYFRSQYQIGHSYNSKAQYQTNSLLLATLSLQMHVVQYCRNSIFV